MQETSANPVQVHIATQTQETPSNQQSPQVNPALPTDKPKSSLKKVLIIMIAVLVFIGLVFAGFYFYRIQNIKKRDGQRKADITRIQGALEQYKNDTSNAKYYPTVLNSSTLEKTGYVAKIPTDPINTDSYIYTYIGSPSPCAGGCTGYTLTACLENKNDKAENTTDPIAPCTTRNYKVSKP